MTGTDPIEISLLGLTNFKVKFAGYGTPTVTRHVGGNEPMLKIVSYSHVPWNAVANGQLVIAPNGTCTDLMMDSDGGSGSGSGSGSDGGGSDGGSTTEEAISAAVGLLVAARSKLPGLAACIGAGLMATTAGADSTCTPFIEVEIHIPSVETNLTCAAPTDSQTRGTCSDAEAFEWTHAPGVFGGYEGCVGDAGLSPCDQDGYLGKSWALGELTTLDKPYSWNADTSTCEASGTDMSTMTLWILWGLPMDTKELIRRTGMIPEVQFPLLRMTYPSYSWGDHGDDALDLKAKFKEFMLYQEAFTTAELTDFDVEVTEGAESGIVILYAAMALHIARTTCNRAIYALVEAPAYGYDNTQAARWANMFASTFFDDASCPCHDAGTCLDPTVTITTRGWVLGEDYPTEVGGDGNTYAADSTNAGSPWFETMVFPENPSGVRKTPRLGSQRRVCDGVYLHPMYFGGDGWTIPLSPHSTPRPDCSSWSFSATKFYSAAIRVGAVMYKNTDSAWATAVHEIIEKAHSMANGLYSEWSWMGQIQIFDMLMAKSYKDPTSWMGAYTTIMHEKWDLIIDGFQNCTDVVEITNPHQGAYVWFKFVGEYRGLQDSWITSFFLQCLGVYTTTYNWGWRGADPAAYHGTGTTVYDFTRLQLYRDVSVYAEVSRRAKIVCAGGSFGDYMTVEEWKTDSLSTGDRRLGSRKSKEAYEKSIAAAAPRLDQGAVKHLAAMKHRSAVIGDEIEDHCREGGYTMSCLFKYTGKGEPDVPFHSA